MQIASDGSQKLPPRLLEPALDRLHAGGSAERIAFVVAAWMRFLLCVDDHGMRYDISDPMAARLSRIAQDHGRKAPALAEALFAVEEIFTHELRAHEGFRTQVVTNLDLILASGVRPALAASLHAQAGHH